MSVPENETVLEFTGDVDLTNAEALEEQIVATLDAGDVEQLTLDMTKLTFLDSVGITLLLKTRNLAHERGVYLTLRKPSPETRRLLELVGVSDLFDVAD